VTVTVYPKNIPSLTCTWRGHFWKTFHEPPQQIGPKTQAQDQPMFLRHLCLRRAYAGLHRGRCGLGLCLARHGLWSSIPCIRRTSPTLVSLSCLHHRWPSSCLRGPPLRMAHPWPTPAGLEVVRLQFPLAGPEVLLHYPTELCERS
jgi:hypothetical protein